MTTKSDTKQKILELLAVKERGWKELKAELGISDPVLSKHIKTLLEKGLITEEIDKKDRRKKIYRINDKGLEQLLDDLLAIRISLDLLVEESEVKEECKRIKNSEDRRKKFLDNIQKMVGGLFLISLLGGNLSIKIALRALELYSQLTDAQLFVLLDKDYKNAYEEIFYVDKTEKS